MKILVIIPTLDEKNNVTKIVKKILSLNIRANILFIDDNSRDGTQSEIIELAKTKKVKYIFRKKKLGIGSAHKLGIKWGKNNNYRYVVTMDCDGTHDPEHIKKMLIKVKIFNIINTNRFNKKNSLKKWNIIRVMITCIRHSLVSNLLDLKFDSSGGFRLYDLKKVKIRDILKAKHNGYSFLWESLFLLKENGYKIEDIDVDLPRRKLGYSKMKVKDILDGFIYLIKIFILNKLFKRF